MNRLSAWAVKRPLGGLALCLCLAALGVVAVADLKISFYASTPFPVLNITTLLPYTGPREVELQVTKPIEDEMRGVLGLRRVYSRSREGRSEVTLELHTTTNVSTAAQQVRARLRRIKKILPWDSRPPVISQYNPAQRPIAVLGLSGGGSLGQAGQWAKRKLKPELLRLKGIADVVISGAPEPEIRVDCDPLRLRAHGLTVRQVALAISGQHESLSGGIMPAGPLRLNLRTAGKVAGPAQVADLPVIGDLKGNYVSVGQVAQVSEAFKEAREITRLNGEPVVTMALYQAWDSDLGRLWGQVEGVLETLKDSGTGQPRVEVVYSQAQNLSQALGRLSWMGLVAAGAAGLVLFLFMRNLGSTLVVLAACPFSLLVALLLLRLLNLQLDILALSGLALALGILVDNAVVVIEAVHHHWQRGCNRREGVGQGVSEVATPIVFSTLTTVAAFLPLLLVSDRVRLQMGGFFWGMSLSLLASLAAALVLVPLLLIYLGPRGRAASRVQRPSRVYRPILDFCLKRAPWVLGGGLLFLGGAAWLSTGLSFPSGGVLGAKGFNLIVVTQPGTPLEETFRQVQRVEAPLRGLSQVERVHSRVWGNQGRLTVTLRRDERVEEDRILAQARLLLPRDGRAQYHLLPLGEGSKQSTLTLNLFGPEMPKLMEFQKRLRQRLARLPSVQEMIVKVGSPVPELELQLNHLLLGRYGLDASLVAQEVRAHLTGPVAFRLVRQDEEVEVRVRASLLAGQSLAALQRVYIRDGQGRQIPLTELITPAVVRAPSELFRQNFRRVIRLTLVLDSDDLLGGAAQISKALEGFVYEPGYAWELDEEVERTVDTRREMLTGAVLALILVYLIMVGASESLIGPLVVMAVAPFAAAGAVLGLISLGTAVSMPVYLGAIILAGMLVNTGLVMIDAMGRLRARGLDPREAARQGALRRLRPVLMTTFSTIAAGMPLLLDRGTGSSAWTPLALTLTSGLLLAALSSLILTPLLYPWSCRLDRLLGGSSPHADELVKKNTPASLPESLDPSSR